MRVVYTEPALEDLEEIGAFLKAHYPSLLSAVRENIQRLVSRLAMWPESAPVVSERPKVRVAFVQRYPYKVFYLVTASDVQILHVHHSSRKLWMP